MTGKAMQRWRSKAGVSEEELARVLKRSRMTVWRWQRRDLLNAKMLRQLRAAAKKLNAPLP